MIRTKFLITFDYFDENKNICHDNLEATFPGEVHRLSGDKITALENDIKDISGYSDIAITGIKRIY